MIPPESEKQSQCSSANLILLVHIIECRDLCHTVLIPNESASLTIEIGAVPNNYRLKSQTNSLSSSHPEFFIWSGKYWVMNTAGTSATTRVMEGYVWEWFPDEGGGGGGEGVKPPDLMGRAAGTATARP
jgi:hypothetical protein